MNEYWSLVLSVLLWLLVTLAVALVWGIASVNAALYLQDRWIEGKRWPSYLTGGTILVLLIFGLPALLTLT